MSHCISGRIGIERYPELLRMIEGGETSVAIGDSFHVDPETIRKFARKRGLLIARVEQAGENHPAWNGGTTLDRSGYILQRVEAESEFGYLIRAIARRGKAGADRAGYAPVHRIVMHQKLGRPLLPGEVVDHIDGNKTNNDPSNLRIFSSNAAHLKETLKGRRPNWTEEGKAKMTGRPKGSRNKPKLP